MYVWRAYHSHRTGELLVEGETIRVLDTLVLHTYIHTYIQLRGPFHVRHVVRFSPSPCHRRLRQTGASRPNIENC